MRISFYGIALSMVVFASTAGAGGNHDHGAPAAHSTEDEWPTVAVTQWTDQLELFMEYPVPVRGEASEFIIHLTLLEDFAPAIEGTVTLELTAPSGTKTRVVADEVLRDGIFSPVVEFSEFGPYGLMLEYAGPIAMGRFEIEGLLVYADAEQVHPPAASVSDEIGFLKEQQWKVPFATAEVTKQEIRHSVRAIANVLPAASSYVEIVAPVSGAVQVGNEGSLVLPGSWVERGDVVARIIPPLQGDGWAASEIALAQAERNFERARRLRERDAISQREFEEAENEYRSRKAGHDRLAGSGSDGVLELTAPIDGQVIDWEIHAGHRVEAGDHLLSVADPSVVWLQVNVYESDLPGLGTPVAVYIASGGGDGWLVEGDRLRVLTTGGSIDPATRTVPVLLEALNPDGRLSINGSMPVELVTSAGSEAIAVPLSALYRDEGLDVVFVQIGGESFEKRRVVLGPRHAGLVSVLEGIAPGERVVVRGGYHVKLASTTAAIGAGHAH